MKKIIIIGIILCLLLSLTVIVSADITWHSEDFGGKLTVTETGADNPPDLNNENPSNGVSGIGLNPELSVDCSNDDGSNFDLYIRTNASGSWSTLQSFLNVGNNTGVFFDADTSNMDQYSTTYYWSVNATDNHGGSGNWTNETYHFTTEYRIILSSESPNNGSSGIGLHPTLQIDVDGNGYKNMNISFWSNASGSWASLQSFSNVGDGVRQTTNTGDINSYSTTYYWSVNTTYYEENTWTNETYYFTTETEPSANITWHSESFGGKLTVTDPGGSTVTWHSESFGGKLTVTEYAWGNWSGYWKIGHTSHSDTNMDMEVNYQDTGAVALEYGSSGAPGWIPEDVNDDGDVNYQDTGAVALDYGENYE